MTGWDIAVLGWLIGLTCLIFLIAREFDRMVKK